MKRAMVDVAFDEMSNLKKPILFVDLWKKICVKMEFTAHQSEDNIAQFYSDLSLDDRFVCVKNNKWDLKQRHTYHEVVVETNDLIIDEGDEVEEFDEEDVNDKVEE